MRRESAAVVTGFSGKVNVDLSIKIENVTQIVETCARTISERVDEFVKKSLITLAPISSRKDKATADLFAEVEETVKALKPTAHKAETLLRTGLNETTRHFATVEELITTKLENASELVKGAQSMNFIRTGAAKSKSRGVATKAVEVVRSKLDEAKKLVLDLNETANNLLNGIYAPVGGECVKLVSAVSARAAAAGDHPAFWDVAEEATSLKAHISRMSGLMPAKISEAVLDAQSSLVPLVGRIDGLAGELDKLDSK